jgi:hypothetical protein
VSPAFINQRVQPEQCRTDAFDGVRNAFGAFLEQIRLVLLDRIDIMVLWGVAAPYSYKATATLTLDVASCKGSALITFNANHRSG